MINHVFYADCVRGTRDCEKRVIQMPANCCSWEQALKRKHLKQKQYTKKYDGVSHHSAYNTDDIFTVSQ